MACKKPYNTEFFIRFLRHSAINFHLSASNLSKLRIIVKSVNISLVLNLIFLKTLFQGLTVSFCSWKIVIYRLIFTIAKFLVDCIKSIVADVDSQCIVLNKMGCLELIVLSERFDHAQN